MNNFVYDGCNVYNLLDQNDRTCNIMYMDATFITCWTKIKQWYNFMCELGEWSIVFSFYSFSNNLTLLTIFLDKTGEVSLIIILTLLNIEKALENDSHFACPTNRHVACVPLLETKIIMCANNRQEYIFGWYDDRKIPTRIEMSEKFKLSVGSRQESSNFPVSRRRATRRNITWHKRKPVNVGSSSEPRLSALPNVNLKVDTVFARCCA